MNCTSSSHYLDQAWKNADASALREQIAQEAMNVLREKLEKLQKEAEKYADRGDGDEYEITLY